MILEKSADGSAMTVRLIGDVDAANAAEIEEKLFEELDGVTELTFDLNELVYISSAGLRVLMKIQKLMKAQGRMVITGTNDEVMEIFKVTGFVRLLDLS